MTVEWCPGCDQLGEDLRETRERRDHDIEVLARQAVELERLQGIEVRAEVRVKALESDLWQAEEKAIRLRDELSDYRCSTCGEIAFTGGCEECEEAADYPDLPRTVAQKAQEAGALVVENLLRQRAENKLLREALERDRQVIVNTLTFLREKSPYLDDFKPSATWGYHSEAVQTGLSLGIELTCQALTQGDQNG
jgi:hypothetical protein